MLLQYDFNNIVMLSQYCRNIIPESCFVSKSQYCRNIIPESCFVSKSQYYRNIIFESTNDSTYDSTVDSRWDSRWDFTVDSTVDSRLDSTLLWSGFLDSAGNPGHSRVATDTVKEYLKVNDNVQISKKNISSRFKNPDKLLR